MSVVAPEVELLWWQGCPSWEQALAELRAVMSALGLDPKTVVVREIDTEADATNARFTGSPTIRVNGDDIQDPGDEPAGLTCRVYRLRDGRVSALPDPVDIRNALAGAMTKEEVHG
jgi:hypothetical protein